MAGIDDNLQLMGDWPPTTPRTQAFLSTILGEDLLPANGNRKEVSLPVFKNQNPGADSPDNKVSEVGREETDISVEECAESSLPKPESRGGLAERVAARAGFNAPKLNTSNIRSNNLGSSSPDVQQSHHHVPFSPGFSPSAFLDSPVFLLNSLAQPSPTTGKFPLGQYNNSSSLSVSGPSDKYKEGPLTDVDTKPFAFKPHLGPSSLFFSSKTDKMDATSDHQELLPAIEVSAKPDVDGNPQNQQDINPLPGFPEPQDTNPESGFSEQFGKKETSADFTFNERPDSAICNENSPPPVDQMEEEKKEEFSSVATGHPSEDGYNWRKYGQKQVKGSEFPRSYYKCTHPNCQVKKKVERSPEGQVTEIIYKGAHNHPKPPVNHRSSVTSSHPFGEQIDGSESHGMQPSMDERTMWANTLNGTADSSDWRNNSVDVLSSATMASEFCDPSVSMTAHDLPCFEAGDAIDVTSTVSNDEDDDGATQGSASIGVDGDEESDLKRRKMEASVIDMSAASRAVREPRIVVQTTSEVDILDDGYRWRKYGQKVVKGNPNPRSYYKCTSVGCTVRKHVERASHDLKSVITTYEGKHNHDVPAARSSSHSNSGSMNTATTTASQSHNIQRRPDPTQAQESFPRFEAPTAFAGFGLPPGREQLGPPTGFSFGLSQQGFSNLSMAGLVPSGPMKMLPQVHSYLGQRLLSEPGYLIPKGEPIDESMVPPNGASAYQQMMDRLPLGPQM